MRPNRANERRTEPPGLADRIDQIDRLLPQTQCRRCGYQGCRPYAEAIAAKGAPINRCPPGGDRIVGELARLLEKALVPLDPSCGEVRPRQRAEIDISRCIGCTKCILACPVDAIVGAARHQHHVLADRCTGCDLCVSPCPVDCITMKAVGQAWSAADAALGRRHHQASLARQAGTAAHPGPPAGTSRDPLLALAAPAERARRLAQIIERARNAPRR